MTHRERALTALTLGQPDYVPTFELEYQLASQMFGKEFLYEGDLENLSPKETERAIKENAEYLIQVYSEMEHSIIPIHYLSEEHMLQTAKYIRQMTNDEFLLTAHGDGTFAIPDGDGLVKMVYWLYDEPEEGREQARKNCDYALERNKRLIDGGIESLILCSDYCFNSGPFLSPDMFAEFIQPYLYEICQDIRKQGGYAIKHTDGNIMPILPLMASCKPDAFHSLDPQGGVSIPEVRKVIGDDICLIGNVNCGLLQTGTDEECRQDVLRSLRQGMERGRGYVFATSNCAYTGMPLERYETMIGLWRQYGNYDLGLPPQE